MFRDLFGSHRPAPYVMELTNDHVPLAADIHAASFARTWGTLELERMIANENIFADGVFIGATSTLLGFALSRIVGDEAEILTIAVSPEARGHGAGRALLTHHLERLARHGARTVFLEVDEGNKPALALYRRARFSEIGRRPGYYPKDDGTKATAITMRASLD